MILNQKIRSIRIDDDLFEASKKEAKKRRTTFSKLVRAYLRKITERENNE